MSIEPVLTSQEAAACADGCNAYDSDAHGNPWTAESVATAHDSPNADAQQTKKLIRLLALIAVSIQP